MEEGKVGMKKCLLLIIFFVITLQGCSNNNPNPPITMVPSVTMPVENKVTVTNVFSTQIPTSTREKQKTEPTPEKVHVELTKTVTPTWVPPSLTHLDIQTLIDTNGNCDWPCWWGLVPGVTTKEQTFSFLDSLIVGKTQNWGPSSSVASDGREVLGEQIIIKYNLPGGNGVGNTYLSFWDNTLSIIRVDSKTAAYRYQLEPLLKKEGKPQEVFIYTQVYRMEKSVPVRIVLVYPEKRTFAHYFMDAYEVGGKIRICPVHESPGLNMWLDGYDQLAILDQLIIGPGTDQTLKPLQEATGISVDEFYEQFTNPAASDCFETSIDYWKGLYFPD